MVIHVLEPLAVSREKTEEMKNLFEKAGHSIRFYPDRNEESGEIVRRAMGADVVVIGNLPFPAKAVRALPDLKMLAVAFTGTDHVAMDVCRERGVTVCNASGYSTVNVAELAVGMMIDLLRNVPRCNRRVREGGTKEGLVGFDLAGKTVGIIGTGAVGLRVAKLLQAFDCRLLACSRSENPEARQYGIAYTTLEDLLKESDIVTLHCPLNDSTRGLIGEEELSLMKPASYIVNCARGPVIRTAELARALKEGVIAGAALDVFDTEPPLPADTPFFPLENTILTPHIAFATEEAFLRRADIVTDNILSWITGTPRNVVV